MFVCLFLWMGRFDAIATPLLALSSFPDLRIKSIRHLFHGKKKQKASIKIESSKMKCIIALKNKPRSLATCQGSGSAILQFSLLSSPTCWLIPMPAGSTCMRSKVPFKLLSTEHPYISMILSQKFGFFKKISSMLFFPSYFPYSSLCLKGISSKKNRLDGLFQIEVAELTTMTTAELTYNGWTLTKKRSWLNSVSWKIKVFMVDFVGYWAKTIS